MDARTCDINAGGTPRLNVPAVVMYGGSILPARKGAVTHAGGKAEVVCYADI
jgi:hypothetical protein